MRNPNVRDPKTLSILACVFLVLLRLTIGWQFVWEGLWKLDSLSRPSSWSAVGYLNNSHGPYRDHFRGLIGDPNELRWLDYDRMNQSWDNWSKSFVAHYGNDEEQRKRLQRELAKLLDGPKTKTSRKFELPEGISFDKTTLKYDPKTQILSFPGAEPPTLTDFARITDQLPEEADRTELQNTFQEELDRLKDLAVQLSYRQRLAALLKGDPALTGVVYADEKYQMETPDPQSGKPQGDLVKFGEKQVYLDMLAEYDAKLKTADQAFEFDHLETMWAKIQAKKNELIGPVKQLDKELKSDALKLLTYEQIARGPIPPEKTQLYKVDQLTIWSLLILGGCLMIGFMTRLAAIAGAGMMISFYLVWPPWPGVPEAPGPEHALFVNKNIIEAVALMALAFMPTSGWFGLDGLICAIFRRKGR